MNIPKNIKNKLFKTIAIDLGTANIRVLVKGSDKIINEPCIVAINKSTGRVIAVGSEARQMVGRTPSNITAIQPLKNGVISDFDSTQSLISHYLNKVRTESKIIGKLSWFTVIIAVPSLISEVEIKAVVDSSKTAGAKKIYIVEEPIAASVGSGIKIADARGSMIVDIGGGTTDIAIISLGSIVVDNTVRVAGDSMDKAIQEYIKSKYNFLIGLKVAEDLKKKIGNAISEKSSEKVEIKGQDLINGLPKSISIYSIEVTEALSPILVNILNAIKEAIEKAPPEIISDLIDNGIHLTGGGALIKNLDKFLSKELRLPVIVPNDPILSVTNGLKLILNDSKLLESVQFKDYILR